MKRQPWIPLLMLSAALSLSAGSSQARLLFNPDGFDNSIVDQAIAINQQTGEFSTLIAALQETGLVNILDKLGPFTAFVPTDAAFAELGITADNLVLDRRLLRSVLLYHVAFGNLLSPDVFGADAIRTLTGGKIRPRTTPSGAFVVDQTYTPSRVLVEEGSFDIQTDNGVIHAIDNVLLFIDLSQEPEDDD